MGKIERFLKMHDGHHAFVRIYVPTKIRGYVHLLHGMTEHSGRYDRFCRILSKIGYFVSIHDHRGHGRSVELDGKFGYFADENGFEKVVEDVHEIIQFVRKEYRLERPIIFGHSMGSFIARRYIQLYSDEVKAVVLSGSGAATSLHLAGNHLAKAFVALKGKDVESHQMNKLSFGSFNKKILNPLTAFDWLTRDERAVQQFLDDPYCGFIPTHQFFVDLTEGLLTISKPSEVAKIRKDLPVLFMSGNEDPIGGKNARGVFKAAAQMQKAGMEKVAVFIFEGMRHEILNEKNKQYVYRVITRWLKNEQQI